MSENAKLRSLLAEAREMIVSQGIAWKGIAGRIDAALAEPVVASRMEKPSNTTWARFAYDFRERAEKAERERDEARAEVEMLRGVGCQDNDKQGEPASGPCGVCRKCAYQRGAEAMREAAARLVDEMLSHTLTDAADRIRTLPVPEDEP